MIPSIAKKTISLAISLLVVVISLTGVALGAGAPSVSTLTSGPNGNGRYTPGFAGEPGKMARDAAGNFYVADFWGKRILKLDRHGNQLDGAIATSGRPTAVAVMKDYRLVVTMTVPTAKIAFYSLSGEEGVVFDDPAPKLYRPVAVTTDNSANEYIYVLDAGDGSSDAVNRVGKIRVYSKAGLFQYAVGIRTNSSVTSTLLDTRFKQPQGITYDSIADKIVVADTLNGRLMFYPRYTGAGSMTAPTSFVGATAGVSGAAVGNNLLSNPVGVAFQYDGTPTLQRYYIAERGRNEVSVFNPAGNTRSKFIPDATVSNATMKFPASVLFERTGTGVETKGVLYVTSAATSTAANILALGIDGGTVPVPTVTMTMADVPSTTAGTSLHVSGTTSPVAAVTCTVNGAASGTVVDPGSTGNWSTSGSGGVALTLESGKMNYILCQSTSGGVTTYTRDETYSGSDPTTVTVAINQPAGTETIYTGVASITLSGTTTPGNATVQLVNSLVGTTTTTSDVSGNWSKVVTLAEGSNGVNVTAWKPGTAVSNLVSRTVVYDNTDPGMTGTISFIAAGATTTNAVQNLDGIVYDANLQSITVNGVPVAENAKVSLPGNNTYFSIPLILNRGDNTVTVTATDKVGHVTTLSRSVTLAPEKPGFIAVVQPADNKFRSSGGVEPANGTVDPSFTSVIACGGTSVTPIAGSWSGNTASIGAGFVSCQLTASGGGSTTVNEKRTFNTSGTYNGTAVTHAPVAITFPEADLAQKIAAVTVSGSVAIGAPTPQISINGLTTSVLPTGTYDSGNGAFTYPVALLPGLNTITVISSGTTAVRNIIYDNTKPDLVIQADSKTMPTFIYGSLEPSAKISAITASIGTPATPVIIPVDESTMKFDTYDQASGAVTWKADLTGYAYDTISFTALDPAGNPSTLPYANGIPTGDIDGDGTVRLADALSALRHVAGTEVIDPELQGVKFFNGDVGQLVKGRAARDGIIDIYDCSLILYKAYGLMAF